MLLHPDPGGDVGPWREAAVYRPRPLRALCSCCRDLLRPPGAPDEFAPAIRAAQLLTMTQRIKHPGWRPGRDRVAVRRRGVR